MKIVVRTPNWLGDCIMALPVFAELRIKFPEAQIFAACRKNVSDVFIANPDINGVIIAPAKKASFKEYLVTIKNLRKEKFDIGILLTNSIGTAFWFYFGGIKRRIGFARDCRSLLLSDGLQADKKILAAHQTEYYLYILKKLGIDAELTNPKLVIKQDGLNSALIELKKLGLQDKRYVTIAPLSAFGGVKDWGIEKYGQVAELIVEKLGVDVLITGTPGQVDGIEKICSSHDRIHNMAGKVSLAGFMGLIKYGNVYLGGDSGGAHTAAALGVPTISIFGITEPSRTRALGKKVIIMGEGGMVTPDLRDPIVVKQARAALEAITIEMIFAEIEKLLKK